MSAAASETAVREKRRAALTSVVAAVFLTVLKLVAGLLTGSLGLLAEAAHSGLDLVAALVTLVAVRVSDRPPDVEHHYGHGKVENLAALFETFLLLVTCAWIVYEAIRRLFFAAVEVEATAWAFLVIVTSIVVDANRSRLLARTARKHRSQALEADALHFSTDIWSSAVVLVGLALVWIAERSGPGWAWLAGADAVAAVGVAGIVVWVSLRLGRRAVAALLDAAPAGLTDRLRAAIAEVPGVQAAGSVRVRQSGPSLFVDVTVDVDRNASLEEAHRIATEVQERVGRAAPDSDVVVHIDPVRQANEILPHTVSAIAARRGLRTHGVHTHEIRGRFFLDLHVEVPEHLNLGEAHEEVSRLEQSIRRELPAIESIHSHIEPLTAQAQGATDLTPEGEAALRERVMTVMRELYDQLDCTRCLIRQAPDGYDVVLRCQAAAEIPVGEAHRLAHEAETRLFDRIPEIAQVLIHVEPRTPPGPPPDRPPAPDGSPAPDR